MNGTAVIGPAADDALHVMSFNLRFASHRSPNSWRQRRPVVAELLRREQPTVLGTQEGLYGQLRDIERDLPGHYAWLGEGRAGGRGDEFVAIFHDTRRLAVLASGNFWLSDTPGVPGSTSWGNVTVRMATWARFADRRPGSEFVVVNTHLDNHSEQARVRAAEQLRGWVAAFTVPVVLTGDFNAPAEGSAAYDVLTDVLTGVSTGAGMTDTWLAAAERRTPQFATWHGYGPLVPDGGRIDWILTRGAVTVPAAAINTTGDGGQFPSDHLPVQALLRLG